MFIIFLTIIYADDTMREEGEVSLPFPLGFSPFPFVAFAV
ncbi:hypothetical protein SAMN05192585_11247 [Acetanaerobacterium elongatum]|uniref:Uncharacterized protein n=1 Tax=Acetanaerobacterium elongatum TaxID=258515 RepID=A0A1G9Z232_9FIRM|nr:hypothetical protein SAMN05192585_11247 [Acetanaerobacterium elongatum]